MRITERCSCGSRFYVDAAVETGLGELRMAATEWRDQHQHGRARPKHAEDDPHDPLGGGWRENPNGTDPGAMKTT